MATLNSYYVTGYVSDSDGNACSSCDVWAYNITDRSSEVSTSTVVDGSFTIDIKTIVDVGDDILVHAKDSSGNVRGWSFDSNTNITYSFTNVSDIDDEIEYYHANYDGTYIYMAHAAHGFSAYSFDGTNISKVSDVSSNGGLVYAFDILPYNGYIYRAAGCDGLFVYTFDGSTFSSVTDVDDGSLYQTLHEFKGDIICGRIYALSAYSFDETNISIVTDVDYAANHTYYFMDDDGVYLYVSHDYDGFGAYTYDGTDLTLVSDCDTNRGFDILYDAGYIYVTRYNDGGMGVYTFDGTNISLVTDVDDGGDYIMVTKDNDDYIYATTSSGTHVYTFDGTNLTKVYTRSGDKRGFVNIGDYKWIYGRFTGIDVETFELTRNFNLTMEEYNTLDITSANYESNLRYCPIDSPNKQINMNIDVLNFWTDDITAVDRSVNTEPLILGGTEWATTASDIDFLAYKFEQIWYMQDDDESITISGVSDCYDGDYVIKDFSFNSIRRQPNAYKWRLTLEYKP